MTIRDHEQLLTSLALGFLWYLFGLIGGIDWRLAVLHFFVGTAGMLVVLRYGKSVVRMALNTALDLYGFIRSRSDKDWAYRGR